VFELAHTGAPVVGTVSVHGSYRDFTPGAAKNIKGRVLILHGAEDPTAPLSEVDLVIKELRQTRVDWQLELYSDADHLHHTGHFGQRPSQCAGVGRNAEIFRGSLQELERSYHVF